MDASGQPIDRAELSAWAREASVGVRWPEQLGGGADRFDFRANPGIDFGRWLERTPGCVLVPADQAGLQACLSFLRRAGLPYKLRGTAHSSGGQTLIEGGVVVDLSRLADITDDRPEAEQITVGGGALWLTVIEHLARQGRRPVTLTDNPRSTVAGTLAVGGFGDTTHLYGLQTANVTGLTLITPDGERHVLAPDAELCRYALAGRGQLGAIAEVTLRTMRRPAELSIRRVAWPFLADFVRDALIIAALRLFEFVRARVFWQDRVCYARGVLGHFGELPAGDAGYRMLVARLHASEVGRIDLDEQLRTDPAERWQFSCPAVEFTLPLPDALDRFTALSELLVQRGLTRYLSRGASVMLVPRQHLPLAPVPDADFSFLVALRPEVPREEAAAVVPHMREVAERAVELGGRLYMMSVEPDRDVVRRQYGAAWTRWAELKRELDPAGLCNHGLLGP